MKKTSLIALFAALCLSNSFAQDVNPAKTVPTHPKPQVDPGPKNPKHLVNKNQIEQKSTAAHADQTTKAAPLPKHGVDPLPPKHESLPPVKNPNKHVLSNPAPVDAVQQKHHVLAPPQTAPVMQKGK